MRYETTMWKLVINYYTHSCIVHISHAFCFIVLYFLNFGNVIPTKRNSTTIHFQFHGRQNDEETVIWFFILYKPKKSQHFTAENVEKILYYKKWTIAFQYKWCTWLWVFLITLENRTHFTPLKSINHVLLRTDLTTNAITQLTIKTGAHVELSSTEINIRNSIVIKWKSTANRTIIRE